MLLEVREPQVLMVRCTGQPMPISYVALLSAKRACFLVCEFYVLAFFFFFFSYINTVVFFKFCVQNDVRLVCARAFRCAFVFLTCDFFHCLARTGVEGRGGRRRREA